MTEEELSVLLRLKRFEQPPPGYFDRLLLDVHRKQRAELLRQPLWRIAFERVQVFFSEHSLGPVSYAGGLVALLVAGVLAIQSVTPSEQTGTGGPRIAVAALVPSDAIPASAPAAALSVPALAAATVPAPRYLRLQGPAERPVAALSHERLALPSPTLTSRPRYVIDARPVSYDLPPSFSF